MLSECSFKISRIRQTSILELWPFGMNDLARLLLVQSAGSENFVAVKNNRWRDGFHPPTAKSLLAQPVSQGLIAHSVNTTALVAALHKPGLDTVVDLKLFFPKRSVSTKADVALLEKHFEAFDDAAALNAWGGCWIHVHDACKTYITLPVRSGLVRTFVLAILQMTGAQLEKKQSAALYQTLCSLPASKCLLLGWFRDVVRYRIESADIHNYEKMDDLILWSDDPPAVPHKR
jgi:hypothetical protein